MRRMLRISICAWMVWLGLLGFEGGAAFKDNAASELEPLHASVAGNVSYYEPKPLLAAHAAYAAKKQLIQEKLAAPAAAAKAEANQKTVYLTFDDGPSKNTGLVLDILKREGITATFFVLGEHVLKQPLLAKRIIEEGHSIGNHTFNHKYEQLYGSFSAFAGQVMKTDDAIYQTTGVRTTLLRAPGGTFTNFDQGYFDGLAAAGYVVHDWNVDSGDSKKQDVPSSEILTAIKGSKLASKLNVLLHDSAGHAESVKALPAIIHYYKSKGYAFAPITDKVEPIQFKVASKLKWNRKPVTTGEIAKLITYAEQLDRNGSSEQVKPEEQKLTLHRGEDRLVLEAGEYRLIGGTIEVSLRKLAEWIGASLELDSEQGQMVVTYEGNPVLTLISKEIKASDMSADLIVPVRATLQTFGIGIAKYVYNDNQREIWVTD
ncbi:peptidoglycan/xylan/chitin deacetylase (PgdA/CDA1 family) [Paenibacillus endophyticus]|uniref:Peptidoglycan/xylan/chitin deacetylase (PgdA/CDA1 family) n=1 Tax=Paenibacillus endophyticus TaxID=1294268 RepID=A0A7W5CBG3_9BACL|nr:polysaccharide deacetylase family protein [Paenibacillus endophyticus]MBB3153724.1 peptidoglycan/xylan/chitin deacetylase (PgdA/CDA1 family) [Paenibacillus endophyticus]